MKKIFCFLLLIICVVNLEAQVAIGGESKPGKGAVLDLSQAGDKHLGLLYPQVALKFDPTWFALTFDEALPEDTVAGGRIKTDAQGMVVYNIDQTVLQGNGLYVWDGLRWVYLGGGAADQCRPVTDIDGNIYSVKQFGEQCWMTQNLRTSRRPNGEAVDSIRLNPGYYSGIGAYVSVARSGDQIIYTPAASAGSTAKYRMNSLDHEMDFDSFADQWGFLYTYTKARTACPAGWKLPSPDDWKAMSNSMGGDYVSGKKMKAHNLTFKANDNSSTYSWGGYPQSNPLNSGFNAIPAGMSSNAYGQPQATTFSVWGCWFADVPPNDDEHCWYIQATGYNTLYNGSLSMNLYRVITMSVRCVKESGSN
ncbi:hypothetical protein FACS189413_06210 [Bacteroidia bacterium]|nr:hypothetical protein FACS189413_06210 [Bacteroidia bacterium]